MANATRLYGRRPLPLIAAFIVVYGIGVGLGLALAPLDGVAGNIAAIGAQVVISILGAFATGFTAIVLSDAIADRRTEAGAAFAILRVHAKELITAGLLATLIGLALSIALPFIWLTILGPPIVAQVIVLEYRPFKDALARTGRLIGGQSTRVILYVFSFSVIVVFLFYMFLIFILPIVAPLQSAAMLLLYLDLRARSEELDYEEFVTERENAMDVPSGEGSNQD